MPWTWVRPVEPKMLKHRPLLDLGTGDGQTLAALVEPVGLVVGMDGTIDLLRPGDVNAKADRLPFKGESFATVLAADLFHHVDDGQLPAVLAEIRRVLRKGGRLVAWWYERPGRDAPDAPRNPRSYSLVATGADRAGFSSVSALELTTAVEAGPPTVGLLARV
jgi:ubiquinone/menaquinone biosynthesis C-methylase UbiE